MFIVYILKSIVDNGFYIGYTGDIKDRIKRHNEGREKSTRLRRPFVLVYQKEFAMRSEAMKHEKYLKSLKNKSYIEILIKREMRGGSSTG